MVGPVALHCTPEHAGGRECTGFERCQNYEGHFLCCWVLSAIEALLGVPAALLATIFLPQCALSLPFDSQRLPSGGTTAPGEGRQSGKAYGEGSGDPVRWRAGHSRQEIAAARGRDWEC